MSKTPPFQLEPENIDVLLRFLADSVRVAARLAPAKWGLTPFEGALRLNVGFCEALTLEPGRITILVLRSAVPASLLRSGVRLRRGWESSPGSALLEHDTEATARLIRILKQIRPAHNAAMQVSATRGFNGGARKGHSDGAIRVLGLYLGRTLPLPTFERPDRGLRRWEGAVIEAQASRFERNQAARRECLEHFGPQCAACGLLFEERYGPEAEGLIHVHHLRPVASRQRRYVVDPKRDLRPVCPNCHAVIHSTDPPLSIARVRHLLRDHG